MSKSLDRMTTKEEVKSYIERAEKEQRFTAMRIAIAKEKLEVILDNERMPKLAIPFMPNNDDICYPSSNLEAVNPVCFDDLSRGHEVYAETGLFFKTEKEAKLSYEKRCAETELLMLCNGLETEFGSEFWVPLFNKVNKTYRPDSGIYCLSCPYRFASKESCQAAINKLGQRKLHMIFNIQLED